MTVEEWKQENPPIRRKPITNADRIRSMTDEELADFLQDIANLGGINGLQKIMTWIEWLKEEVKE